MLRTGEELGKSREQWMDGIRRSMINKDFIEGDAEDKVLWRSKFFFWEEGCMLYCREVLNEIN